MTTIDARSALTSALLILILGTGAAMAQDKNPQIYNAPGTQPGATAPLFLKNAGSGGASGLIGGVLPSNKAYGMNSATVASSPQNVKKAEQQFQANSARQQAINQQIRDARLAGIRAEFDATKAREDAADAARIRQQELQRQQQAAAAGKPVGAAPAAAAPVVSPYAGSNVVFTGKKKDGDEKPVRLFNTR